MIASRRVSQHGGRGTRGSVRAGLLEVLDRRLSALLVVLRQVLGRDSMRVDQRRVLVLMNSRSALSNASAFFTSTSSK
jgi:hypothetical protein